MTLSRCGAGDLELFHALPMRRVAPLDDRNAGWTCGMLASICGYSCQTPLLGSSIMTPSRHGLRHLVEFSGTQGEPAFPLTPRLGFRAPQPYLGRRAYRPDQALLRCSHAAVPGARSASRGRLDSRNQVRRIQDAAGCWRGSARARSRGTAMTGRIATSRSSTRRQNYAANRPCSMARSSVPAVSMRPPFTTSSERSRAAAATWCSSHSILSSSTARIFGHRLSIERREQLRRLLPKRREVAPPVQRGDHG